jgi:hypothetical protein
MHQGDGNQDTDQTTSALPPKADIGRPILSCQNSGGIIACPPGSTSGGPFAHCPALSVQSAGFHTSEVACEQRSVKCLRWVISGHDGE